ncbi:hypothetical protein EDEG_01091 [Edhazardia aedis USNM 41457]|uniref:Uncharacterized protein n=1 Tax=Edhazardia aedis (strain USNM 41457) TaxID=1003232 RepID=J9DQ77_EDHAE|nr:hypothetical protein EDEG_01091 [Edhazardia aedis USNM 41457]|eukprot:EJW04705.1 hypothetical protein EDEG_01091 [Edhazardia aedis USNM 41457]
MLHFNHQLEVSTHDIKCIDINDDLIGVGTRSNQIFIYNQCSLEELHVITLNSYVNSIKFGKLKKGNYCGANDNISENATNSSINNQNGNISNDNDMSKAPNKNSSTILIAQSRENNTMNNEYFTILVAGTQRGDVFLLSSENNFAEAVLIYSHTQNVCSIDILENFVLSCSWDGTLKIVNLKKMLEIFSYETSDKSAVWCGKFYNKSQNMNNKKNDSISNLCLNFVIGCANKKIILFENFNVCNEINCHLSAVRGLIVLDLPFIGNNVCKYEKENTEDKKLRKIM